MRIGSASLDASLILLPVKSMLNMKKYAGRFITRSRARYIAAAAHRIARMLCLTATGKAHRAGEGAQMGPLEPEERTIARLAQVPRIAVWRWLDHRPTISGRHTPPMFPRGLNGQRTLGADHAVPNGRRCRHAAEY